METEGLGELIQISRAIERIENGTYGNCSDCGGQIAEERLIAIAYAELCIRFAEYNSLFDSVLRWKRYNRRRLVRRLLLLLLEVIFQLFAQKLLRGL